MQMESKPQRMLLLCCLVILSLSCLYVDGEVTGHFQCMNIRSSGEYYRDVDINNINNREDTTTEQSTDTTAISDRILNTGYTTSAEADSTITTDYITTTITTTTDRISETLYTASAGTSPTISHTDVDTTMQGTDRINNTVNNTITENDGEQNTCTGLGDCLDIYRANCTSSGIYTIDPPGWPGQPFEVYCNMTNLTVDDGNTDCSGGGWTVIQRRVNGSVDFYRNWTSYKEGFGQPDHEFWLGNEKHHFFTSQRDHVIRIDVVRQNRQRHYVCGDNFLISDEGSNYEFHVSSFGSGAHNYWVSHVSGIQFSAYDNDNDRNCAAQTRGAWWYAPNNCWYLNLNGPYDTSRGSVNVSNLNGNNFYNVRFSEIKMRKKN